jgi:adenylyltransferase/sulfurtransferase
MLWGQEIQESLLSKKIAIIGCGGLGCSVAIALSGSGIGKIDLVDFDKVEVHNIHRQIAFDEKSSGRYKSEVLKEVCSKRNSDIQCNAYKVDFDAYIKELQTVDLIIDATDNLQTRAQIDSYAKKRNVPWIYGSVEEFHGQVAFFDACRFEDVLQVKSKEVAGIAAPMVMQVASFEANLALRYLVGLKVAKDVLNYLFYDDNGQFKVQSFAMPKENSD